MRMLKRVLLLVLALVFLLSTMALAAAADSSVTYEGGAERFVFLPGSIFTDTDLFENFKDLMPGDSVEQKITVKNTSREYDYVKIYLRAVLHEEETNPLSPNVSETGETIATMTDFLSQLSMTVKNGETTIFEASPDELDGLKDNVLLGTYRYGDSSELTVNLNVPIEMGNEYQYRTGEVDWVFVAELYKDDKPVPPPTGEVTLVPYIVLMVVSILAIVALLIWKPRKKDEE